MSHLGRYRSSRLKRVSAAVQAATRACTRVPVQPHPTKDRIKDIHIMFSTNGIL